jgi:hypothetical protein
VYPKRLGESRLVVTGKWRKPKKEHCAYFPEKTKGSHKMYNINNYKISEAVGDNLGPQNPLANDGFYWQEQLSIVPPSS